MTRLLKSFLVGAILGWSTGSFGQAQKTLDLKNVDDQVIVAKQFLRKGDGVNALPLLRSAASQGSEEAKYHLGLLYMHGGGGLNADLDAAFGVLSDIRGRHETQAQILIGVIFAEGSANIGKDLGKATVIFNKVAGRLSQESVQVGQAHRSMDDKAMIEMIERNSRWYHNWAQLLEFSKKYGIKLNLESPQGGPKEARPR
jgi:TPR repeat protein